MSTPLMQQPPDGFLAVDHYAFAAHTYQRDRLWVVFGKRYRGMIESAAGDTSAPPSPWKPAGDDQRPWRFGRLRISAEKAVAFDPP